MRRSLALLALIVGLAPGTWLRSVPPPSSPLPNLRMVALAPPPASALAPHLGRFSLAGTWRLDSSFEAFGGYSALVIDGDGHFTAFSDRGTLLHFARPGDGPGFVPLAARTVADFASLDDNPDSESATRDPATGTLWTGWETINLIVRHDADGRETGRVRPPGMAGWPVNKGVEAMARLADGRFVMLCECFAEGSNRRHPALLFGADPVAGSHAQAFELAGPPNFRPVDMAQLPDGRVLVLMRRLVWPMPPRFAGAILIADPARIAPGGTWRAVRVAHLASSLPVDNFEAMAIGPRGDGRVDVWLLSDDNGAVTQKTLLWRLVVDPKALP